MRAVFIALLHFTVSFVRSRQSVALEIVALRHQLAVLHRQTKRPRLTSSDRLLWVALRWLWPKWERALVIVKPATVIGWHRAGFRPYWRWKSRPKGGRPRMDSEVRKLIRQMWLANPTWGRPRIQAELAKVGILVSNSTVRKYRPKRRGPPSQTWRTFLENHLDCTVGMDFFVVVTATFRILYVLVIVSHERRRILHFNVTSSPSAQWTAQQVVQAFPFDTAPRFSSATATASTARSFASASATSESRRCSRPSARRGLHEFLRYYHADRTHQGLANDCPESRPVERPSMGHVVEVPRVGGLHHRSLRRAA